jgi:hypothetical protein
MQEKEVQGQRLTKIIPLAKDVHEKKELWDAWSEFDASACDAFNPRDKQRILEVISESAGGVESFNHNVKQLLSSLREEFRRCDDWKDARLSLTPMFMDRVSGEKMGKHGPSGVARLASLISPRARSLDRSGAPRSPMKSLNMINFVRTRTSSKSSFGSTPARTKTHVNARPRTSTTDSTFMVLAPSHLQTE